MNEHEYLNKNIFVDLKNLNDGFDSDSIKYFNQSDFEIVLSRVEKLGIGILGIEPWKNGEFYDVTTFEDYSQDPTDPSWYRQAFKKFIETCEQLQIRCKLLHT